MDRKRLCLILSEILNGADIEPYKVGCKHLNLAANVCGYIPVSLGKLIKEGILSDISSIHRITIDQATEEKKNGEAVPDN